MLNQSKKMENFETLIFFKVFETSLSTFLKVEKPKTFVTITSDTD